ncbi:guanine-1-methyltransferase-domain-containing protein [Lasiosphaeria hispida]|uniref:tRNA (guanine(9)-N1)-methyltransferase n=1 Tax=Lasiosphaeria hispida TaxID=260671 RepID=A0AAJ0MBF0_9PEZI|nr:guanine-1-methyltransferase-domain-containing protein [Lasiosphaeria hispida]
MTTMSCDPHTAAMEDQIHSEAAANIEASALEAIDTSNNPAPPTNGKRKAETELDRDTDERPAPGAGAEGEDGAVVEADGDANPEGAVKPMSKNELKRLRKQQAYKEFKEDRKAKRKDRRHARQDRKRTEREVKIAEALAAGIDPKLALRPEGEPWRPRPVPVAFILDCDFEHYMREPEIVSLSSQVVRSYAQNRKAKYQAHLLVSSWGGKMKTRFETVMQSTHKNWKGVTIVDQDFCEAAKKAYTLMAGPEGGELIDVLKPSQSEVQKSGSGVVRGDVLDENTPASELEPEDVDQSIVYLSSESPYTLTRLEPNVSYVVGGLVDRNREKGLCYKRAREHKVRTAKLPIGEYMAMQSRYVLTTNQVVEIMAQWLECGDWGEAFLSIIPKRKGGALKQQGGSQADTESLNGGVYEGEDHYQADNPSDVSGEHEVS